ncbi:hypothetical protein D3C86_1380280 [compost metagenome]
MAAQRGLHRQHRHIGHFLVREPAAHGDQGPVRRLRQAMAGLERGLAGALAGEVAGVVALRQQAVGVGRPRVRVHAVGNGAEHVGAVAQQAVQPMAEGFGEDLARVGVAHRGHAVRVADAGLQEIELAPELDAVRRQAGRRQAQRGGAFHREHTLEGEVVDGGHRGHRQAARAHQQWRERRMPVVRVDQLGRGQRRLAGGDQCGGVGQRGEALGVVAEVSPGGVHIERAGAVVERWAVQQHHAHAAVRRLALQQPRRAVAGRQRHRQPDRAEAAQVLCRRHGPGITGHQDRDIGAALMQRLRQSAHHICQPAGLCQGMRLCRHKQDVRVQDETPLPGRLETNARAGLPAAMRRVRSSCLACAGRRRK